MRSSKNSIHFVGYLCNDTPGKKLLTSANSGNKFIDEAGKEHNIKCRVEQFNFSAHANYRDLINLPRILQPKKLIYVHGDKESLENLAEELQYEFEIKIPKNFEEIIL
jgi:predicted metal-dependent RNase